MAEIKNTMDMCKGPLFKQVVLFSLPLFGTMLLQLTFNAADIIVVGQFRGAECVGATGSTSSLVILILNFFFGLSVGTNVLAANFFGAKNFPRLRRLSYTSITVAFFGGLFLAVLGQFISEPLLRLMKTPPTILPLAAKYMEIYFVGAPVVMINVFGAALLRSVGDTKRPLYFLIYSGILNVILNFIFVASFGMDVDGVAWATVISQCLSAILIMRVLMEPSGIFLFKFKYLLVDWKLLKRMLALGVPACIQGSCFTFSNVLMQMSVNTLGAVAVSGNAIAQSLEGVVYTGSNAYHQTAVAFVAQNEGGGQRARSILSIKYCCLLGFIVPEIVGVLFSVFGNEISLIYDPTASQAIVAEGMRRILVTFPIYGLCGIMDAVSGGLRGIGESMSSMIIMLFTVCLVRILWVFFVFPAYPSITALMLCYPLTWLLCTLVCLLYLIYKFKQNRPSLYT